MKSICGPFHLDSPTAPTARRPNAGWRKLALGLSFSLAVSVGFSDEPKPANDRQASPSDRLVPPKAKTESGENRTGEAVESSGGTASQSLSGATGSGGSGGIGAVGGVGGWGGIYLELGTTSDPARQIAIVRSLGAMPADRSLPPLFLPLLLELFSQSDSALSASLVAVLSRYEDEPSLALIREAAMSPYRPLPMRLGALAVLGHHRTQSSAAVLVRLIDADQPVAVREAAFESLAGMTGLDHGPSVAAWQQWWSQWRLLSPAGWVKAIQDHQQAKYDRLKQEHQQVLERLVESQRQLYRVTAADQRSALLSQMLSDPLPGIRLLGLTLTNTLLGEKGPAGIDRPLRQAVVAKLQDSWPEIRRRSALLARDLAEEAAADQVAQILIAGQEQRPELLKAYFQVMAQMPRASAMAMVVKRMVDPSLEIDACQALVAAVEAGRLPEHLRSAIGDYWRDQTMRPRFTPFPALVRLLGHLGQEPEWDRIQRWLDSSDPQVRQAAALAWSRSERSLELLLPRCDDPAIYSALLTAAAKRGDDPVVLRYVAGHKPAASSLQPAWRLALEGMASRCLARDVGDILPLIQAYPESSAISLSILSRTIDRDLPASSASSPAALSDANLTAMPGIKVNEASVDRSLLAVGDLLLWRAEIRMAENDPRAVLADAQRLTAHRLPLDARQQQAWERLLLKARLASGDWDSLPAQLKRLADQPHLFGDPPTGEGLWGLAIQTIQRHIAAGQPDRAGQLLQMVDQALADRSPADQPYLADRRQLANRLPPPSPPPSSSSPPINPAASAPAAFSAGSSSEPPSQP